MIGLKTIRRGERVAIWSPSGDVRFVDGTYLVAQYQHPDRLIRVDGGPGPQLHLHDN
jgi:hypothetical protein